MSVKGPSRRAAVLGLAASSLAAPASRAQGRAARPRVDLLLPLTGAGEAAAADIRDLADAARLAISDHAAGAATAAALALADTTGTPLGAAAAAAAARAGGSQLILGPLFGPEAAAAGKAATDLPLISFSNDRSIARRGLYVFGFQPETEVGTIAQHARRSGFGAVSLFGPGGPLHARAEAALRRAGDLGPVTTYAAGDRTAAAGRHVQALLAAGSRVTPVVFLTAPAAEIAAVADALQAASARYGPLQIAGGSAVAQAELREPGRLKGAIWAAADPAARRGFAERFEARHRRAPGRLAGLGYDAAYLAAVLAAEGRVSVTEVERASGFFGVDGLFRFAADGVVERALAVLQLTPAGPTVVAAARRSF